MSENLETYENVEILVCWNDGKHDIFNVWFIDSIYYDSGVIELMNNDNVVSITEFNDYGMEIIK